MVLQDDNDPDLWVVAGAFDIAEALKESEWSIVEAALRGLYTGLKGTSSAWVKEEDRVLE